MVKFCNFYTKLEILKDLNDQFKLLTLNYGDYREYYGKESIFIFVKYS